jgi:hypothetical protein
MGLYEGIKDVAKIVQKADNIELYRQLLDLGAQALEMQAEIARLKDENAKLKKKCSIEDSIIRHEEPFITLKDDDLNIRYCAICWAKENKLYQMNKYFDGGRSRLRCSLCHNRCSDTDD